MPCDWLYNPIIKINAIGNVIETLGNIIKTLKISPTITISVCYYISQLHEQWTSGLGRFYSAGGVYNTGTCALPDIYALTLGRCTPSGIVCIYQVKHSSHIWYGTLEKCYQYTVCGMEWEKLANLVDRMQFFLLQILPFVISCGYI